MAKIRLHIDPIGIGEKADEREWGRISRRVLKKDSIEEVTVAQLAQKLRTGHTVCPAILDGSKAADWQEQQVFMVDIDNADQGHPQLSQEQALRICDDYELSPVISYQTFSHSDKCPNVGIANEELGFYGVQFHPESVMTPDGKIMIENFIDVVRGGREQ